MRILFVTLFFPPSYNAGTENYTLGLAQGFTDKGHDVEVVCADDWGIGDNYWNGVTTDDYKGIRVHRLHLNWAKAVNPNQVLYDSHQVETWLNSFLEKNQFDIVHVTSTQTLGVGVLRAARRAGIPLVLTLMDFWFLCPNAQLIRNDGSLCDGNTTSWECISCSMAESNLFARIQSVGLPQSLQAFMWGSVAKFPVIAGERGMRGMLLDMAERKRVLRETTDFADIVISHSEFLQKMFEKNQIGPITVLRHGLDLGWLDNSDGKAESDSIRFGYIGQIQWTKGVHVLIDAFQTLEIGEKASLQIWGDLERNPSYVGSLRSRMANTPSIEFCGRFEQDDIALVLSEIDVLVVPSIWYENSPLVIKEAFAAGIPVIASDLGGMAELVAHEVDGLVFKMNDPEDLAVQMRRIIEEPGLLTQLRNGIRPMKRIETEVTELEGIYYELFRTSEHNS